MQLHAERARIIPSGPGPEDLALVQVDGETGILTGSARRGLLGSNQGRLEVYVPGWQRFRVVEGSEMADRAYVGLSVIASSMVSGFRGEQLAYVVSTRRKTGGVEVFRIKGSRAERVQSVPQTPLLKGANGIAAARDGTVYVSTFGTWPKPNSRPCALAAGESQPTSTMNVILMCRPEAVAECRAPSVAVVAMGINGANGLALSSDETLLLGAAYHAKRVLCFQRDALTGGLKGPPQTALATDFHPDNLKVLPNGDFIVAGQRSFLACALHLVTGCTPARGAALTFKLTTTGPETVRDWRIELEGDAAAPSTALPLGEKLYAGHIIRAGVREVHAALDTD